MTVQELIKELENQPLDALVFLDNGDGQVMVDEVEVDKYYGYVKKVVIK